MDSAEDYANEADQIYLPVEKKNGDLLYNSLIDMINVAENLNNKPSSTPDYYTDDDSVEVFDLAKVRETPAKKAPARLMYPQVARVQDRGINEEVPLPSEEWSLPKMEWDPADTPVATAVLGSVMLFLISVVVSLGRGGWGRFGLLLN